MWQLQKNNRFLLNWTKASLSVTNFPNFRHFLTCKTLNCPCNFRNRFVYAGAYYYHSPKNKLSQIFQHHFGDEYKVSNDISTKKSIFPTRSIWKQNEHFPAMSYWLITRQTWSNKTNQTFFYLLTEISLLAIFQ